MYTITHSAFLGGDRTSRLRTYADLESGAGNQDPLENHKNIGFFAILVRIPWKMTELPSQHSLSASKTPLKWHFAGGLITACFKCDIDPLSTPHHLKNVLV